MNRVLDLGVDDSSSMSRVRWVRTINAVALAAAVASVGFAALYLFLDAAVLWPVILTNLVWVVGYTLVLAVNHRGHPRVAVWLLLVVGVGNTVIPGATLGVRSGIYLFIILIPMLGILVSGRHDNLLRGTVIVLGLALFIVVPLFFGEAPQPLRGTTTQTVLFVISATGVAAFSGLFALYYRHLVDTAEDALAEANELSEALLLNVLPEPIAQRLKLGETPIADRVERVTVLFADIVDSTPMSTDLSADELVRILDGAFTRLDNVCDRLGLEKISTVGDGYVAVAGLPIPRDDHIHCAADAALEMLAAMDELSEELGRRVRLRIGMCSGPVVAGVIGKRKFRYDIWGETVNTASRMQTSSLPGMIQVPKEVRSALEHDYTFDSRGSIAIKGIGIMETHFLLGRRQYVDELAGVLVDVGG